MRVTVHPICKPASSHDWRSRQGAAALALTAALLVGSGCQDPTTHAAPPPAPVAQQAALTNAAPTFALGGNELREGTPVPDLPFTLQDGFQLSLPTLKGKPIAVFFCPTATDPNCVREAQGLRDHYEQLHEQHNVVIVGVSSLDAAAHRAYISQQNIPFDFASDADGNLARAFGVPSGGNFLPRTFLIGRDGTIRSRWLSVDPEAHSQAILAAASQ